MGKNNKSKKNDNKKIVKKSITKKKAVIELKGSTNYYTPQFLNPEFSELAMLRPESRSELNKIIRWFYANDPIVNNIINLHSTYPVSKFTISGISDPYINRFFEDLSDDLNIMRLMSNIFKEYNLIGEAFPYGVWDGYEGKFINVILLDPDDLEVKSHPVLGNEYSLIYLKNLEEVRNMAEEDEEFDKQLQKRVDKKLYEAIMNDEEFLIPDFNIAHIANFSSPKSTRGTGLVQSILNELFYKLKLQKALIAAADRYINPTVIYTLSPILENTEITQHDVDEFTNLLVAARRGQVSEIVFWQKVDMKQTSTKLPSLSSEFNRVDETIMIGLMVNKSIIAANGPTWNAASIAKRILISRYVMMRDLIEDYLDKKIFKPVSQAQMFYEIDKVAVKHGWNISPKFGRKKINLDKLNIRNEDKLKVGSIVKFNGLKYKVDDLNVNEGWVVLSSDDARKLIVPKLNWRGKIDLTEDDKLINFITSHWDKGEVPFQLLADLFDLDPKYIEDYLIKEKGTVFDYTYRKAQDKVANDTKKAPDTYKEIYIKSLEDYYKRHPDEKPDDFDEKKEQFLSKEGSEDKILNIGDLKFKMNFGVDEKLSLLGYGKSFLKIYEKLNNKKITKVGALRVIADDFGEVADIEYDGSILDYYWNMKFKFWASHNKDRVIKMCEVGCDDFGKGVLVKDGYTKGMIKNITEGFVDDILINGLTKNGVDVIGMPLYLKFFIDDVILIPEVHKVVFSDVDDFVNGILFVNMNREGIKIVEHIRKYEKKELK